MTGITIEERIQDPGLGPLELVGIHAHLGLDESARFARFYRSLQRDPEWHLDRKSQQEFVAIFKDNREYWNVDYETIRTHLVPLDGEAEARRRFREVRERYGYSKESLDFHETRLFGSVSARKKQSKRCACKR